MSKANNQIILVWFFFSSNYSDKTTVLANTLIRLTDCKAYSIIKKKEKRKPQQQQGDREDEHGEKKRTCHAFLTWQRKVMNTFFLSQNLAHI